MTSRLGSPHIVTGRVAVILASLLIVTSGAAPAAGASVKSCRVTNADSGQTHTRAQHAVNAAKPGARLVVSGICYGGTVIDRDLVLEGFQTADSGRPMLSGAGRVRVLTIESGVRVKVRGLVILRGQAFRGAGIRNRGNLVLRDVIVRHCRTSGYGKGGGVHNTGRLTLNGSSRIGGNVSFVGPGGVLNEGTLVLNGASRISRNGADRGGGVENLGTLTMNAASAISDNRAVYTGGVWNMGVLIMNDSSSITRNYSQYTGGVENLRGATLTLNDTSSISGNTGEDWGGSVGGVRNYRRGTVTLNDSSSISDNAGSGVSSGGAVTMNDSTTISGNTWWLGGGGVSIYGMGSLTMDDSSSVGGNEAAWGGGVWIGGRKGTLTMNDASALTDNQADETGGGVHLVGGTVRMTGAASISGNTAQGLEDEGGQPGEGGGLYRAGGRLRGATCGPGGNVYGNTPDDCFVRSQR